MARVRRRIWTGRAVVRTRASLRTTRARTSTSVAPTATSISRSFQIADGRFDVPREQNITAHPVDRGIVHPARFRGRILGSSLTLTIQLTDTTVTLGPVLLTFGKEPRMGPCPICRRPR